MVIRMYSPLALLCIPHILLSRASSNYNPVHYEHSGIAASSPFLLSICVTFPRISCILCNATSA
uniref:Secreted protein n=1 Tax=Moniliophthora roreri TaxID=221103 RepID=A0A0W0FYY2_MONRR